MAKPFDECNLIFLFLILINIFLEFLFFKLVKFIKNTVLAHAIKRPSYLDFKVQSENLYKRIFFTITIFISITIRFISKI